MSDVASAADTRLLLDARGLSKSFWSSAGLFGRGSETRALDDVTATLRPGEILGLVGESGCGKSTFAKVLLGLERADAGDLRVGGRTIFSDGNAGIPAAERGIQMVFQDPYGSLNPRMRVRELVGEGLRISGKYARKDITDEVRRHLALVGLDEDALTKYAHQFSGGQRQRLCVARAIIVKPRLLLADEAVSALDVSVQMQILNLLLELRDRIGLGIVFISHDMGVIEYLCDRIAVMYRGRIVEENIAGALLDAPRHPYTRHLIAARPRFGSKVVGREATAVEPDPKVPAPARETSCVFVDRCPRALPRCRAERPVLAREGVSALACFNPA